MITAKLNWAFGKQPGLKPLINTTFQVYVKRDNVNLASFSVTTDQNGDASGVFEDFTPSQHITHAYTLTPDVGVNRSASPFTFNWNCEGTAKQHAISVSKLEPTWIVNIPDTVVKTGDIINVVLEQPKPNTRQLSIDLTARGADPTISREWRVDLPHVELEHRSSVGTPGVKSYYYWVRKKEQPPLGKSISCKQAEAWLQTHPDLYAVPQVFKFFNQLDARPNRYGMLSVRGLGWVAPLDDNYKLRIKRLPVFRHDDEDLNLKQVHQEWELIRANQLTKIPKALWDKLVDTLCGEVPPGDELPAITLTDYDARSAIIPASWGLGNRQALCPPGIARTTIKNTLLAPKALKYDQVQEKLVPDIIDLPGFDVALLDTYLATPASIRELMAKLWSLGSARQVNELFFAVLEDALVETREFAGIFKTSFIAVDDVRTVSSTAQPANFL